ncbi:hypothetical protein FRACYDRAFT_258354 [Fragilariopsis cylindrus CCMP1102]|uniref:Uncharacterized protein n=1 Tax=Fragilariopsis cylindrus CCMP1102 TaxID=635003 RepID=A0A1E7EIR5_9STRA|nr:hypothetical protein FRACYDRAFT_258354 [Fragilariopsis cylindrus CCMP1102]|eukprot:OEU05760.1 hypothetical protein FRACYDRAFT_258354 [Fragilariopsis cylindrus CCMP1102]
MIGDSRRQTQRQKSKRLLSSTTTTSTIITSSWKEIALSYYNSYSSSSGDGTTNNRESSTSNNNKNQEMVSSASTSTSTTLETLQQQDNNNNNEKKKKRKQLAVMIETSVRKRLKRQFPNEFDNSSCSGCSSNKNNQNHFTSFVSFQTLLTLNGFQRIVIPTGNNAKLYLAEGVVVTPRTLPAPTASSSYYSEFTKRFSNNNTMLPKERLYVQQQHQKDDATQQHESLQLLPNFVQEDITLYQIIENSAAQFLDRRYISITGFFDRRFIRPLTDVKFRTRIAMKSVQSIKDKFQNRISPSEKSLMELLIDKISNNNNKNNKKLAAKTTLPSTSSLSSLSSLDDTTANFKTIPDDDVVVDPVMLVSSATPPLSSSSLSLSNEEENEDKDPLETLMVISSRPSNDINNNQNKDEIILSATIYNYMTPSTRKYYLLKHSSASTLVSCSIVIFGAIPLSYRSYLFSIQYSDLLSSTSSIMAMSV